MDTRLLKINIEEVGKKYSMLTIIEVIKEKRTSNKSGNERVDKVAICLCDCGNIHYADLSSVKFLATKSCGCLSRTIKGDSDKEIYYRWNAQTKNKEYSTEPEWHHFPTFEKWCIENNFSTGDTVVRIDTSKPFGPSNARIQKLQESHETKDFIYYIVSPSGEEDIVGNLNEFCFKHELSPYMLHRVAHHRSIDGFVENKHASHLGWTVDKISKDLDFDIPTYEDRFFYPFALS